MAHVSGILGGYPKLVPLVARVSSLVRYAVTILKWLQQIVLSAKKYSASLIFLEVPGKRR